jgi:hypothetical protein
MIWGTKYWSKSNGLDISKFVFLFWNNNQLREYYEPVPIPAILVRTGQYQTVRESESVIVDGFLEAVNFRMISMQNDGSARPRPLSGSE